MRSETPMWQPNITFERTTGSHSLAAAAQRDVVQQVDPAAGMR
jgi:hypothetical protein